MDAKREIENIIETNEVCLFMKGVPEAPQCGFSMAVSNILKHLNVNFKGINVLENEEIRNDEDHGKISFLDKDAPFTIGDITCSKNKRKDKWQGA